MSRLFTLYVVVPISTMALIGVFETADINTMLINVVKALFV